MISTIFSNKFASIAYTNIMFYTCRPELALYFLWKSDKMRVMSIGKDFFVREKWVQIPTVPVFCMVNNRNS